jgi:hypothetical protein
MDSRATLGHALWKYRILTPMIYETHEICLSCARALYSDAYLPVLC